MPEHICPDYYAWLAEIKGKQDTQSPRVHMDDTLSTSPTKGNVDMTSSFLQLPLVDGRPVIANAPGDGLSPAELWKIEQQTRQQSSSDAWHKERSSRLTASMFHSVARRKKQPDDKFLKQLFSDGLGIGLLAALVHGNVHEDSAVDDYVCTMNRLGSAGLTVFRVGLCVHPQHSCLGASPDRLVHDPTATPSHGLLEGKCPITLYDQDLTPEEGAAQADIFLLNG